MVKGILCRDLYPKKNHRPSLDEDLLIPEAEFAACNRAIRDYGMEPSGSDDPTAEEISWRSDEHYIEAHRTLFSTESELFGELNGLFSDVTERETPYPVENGRTVFSMPPRERLEKTYPELREHPAKLPLVWVKRLWKYAKETKNTKNDSAAESLRIAKERTELLKYYHIVR